MKMDFSPTKGMSYVISKRIAECTEQEKAYKRAYAKWVKSRFIARHSPERCRQYNHEYSKLYYAQHRDEHIARVKRNTRKRRERNGQIVHQHRGRPNQSGIVVVAIKGPSNSTNKTHIRFFLSTGIKQTN